MSDVTINVRGRDDGLGQLFDNLSARAKKMGVDVGDVMAEINNASGVQHKRDIASDKVSAVRESQRGEIQSDFSSARSENIKEWAQVVKGRAGGSISAEEFNKRREEFTASQGELNKQEQSELQQLDKDSNLQLRLIYKLILEGEKRKREQSQNDKKDFEGSGYIGGLQNDIKTLEEKRKGATEEELQEINREIAEKKKLLGDATSGNIEGEGGSGRGKGIRNFINTAGSAGSGDLVGTAQGAIGMVGGTAAMIGGAIIGAIVGFMFNGQKVQENLQQASSMRGVNGLTGEGANRFYSDQLTSGWADIGKLGKSPDEIATMMGQKSSASRVGGSDLMRRTMDDYAFNKGFGADSGVFSQFERFNKGQKESTEIALDTLNTLATIERSSLKEGDLVTLSEKLKSQETIMSIQRSKTDSTDSNAALRLMAGFESVGLSGKGEKGGEFLARTINGLGEGGGDDLMMLKYQMMSETNPELLNDPAAMQRALKYKNSDPAYIEHSLKRIYQMSGGNQLNYQDMIYGMFGSDLSELDLQMYRDVGMGKGQFNPMLGGRNGTMNKGQMYNDAESSVGMMTQWMNQFQGGMQNLFDLARGVMAPGGGSIKVTPTTSSSAVGAAPGNTTRRGR